MIKPDTKYDFSPLGFLRFFALARWMFKEIEEYKEDNAYLREKIIILSEELTQNQKLTPIIKESNNIAVPVISETDDRDESFYERRPNETIEVFLERIGTYSKSEKASQPVTKTVRSANDLIEDARRAHIKSFIPDDREESKNIIVSDQAISRIGNEIATAKGQ